MSPLVGDSIYSLSPVVADGVSMLQGQSEDVSEQLNEEEQLLVISRLHQVRSAAVAVHFYPYSSDSQMSQLCSIIRSPVAPWAPLQQRGVPYISLGTPAAVWGPLQLAVPCCATRLHGLVASDTVAMA